MNRIYSLLFCLLITACSLSPTATLPPSPQPVSIAFSSSLQPAVEALHTCANDHPEMALTLDKRPVSSFDLKANDLNLWWGEKPAEVSYAYPLAQDELVVILNQANPNEDLSSNELRALFSGRIQDWDEISTYQNPVAVWIHPEGNELQTTIQESALGVHRFSPLAFLAPSPQAMIEAIANDPGGIGFLPRSWLTPEIIPSQIDPSIQTSLSKPVLALLRSEPQDVSLILLDCLQNGVGRTALLDYYSPPAK